MQAPEYREITAKDEEYLLDLKQHPGFHIWLERLVQMEVNQARRVLDPASTTKDRDSYVLEGMSTARALLETLLGEAVVDARSHDGDPLVWNIPTTEMTQEMLSSVLRGMTDGQEQVRPKEVPGEPAAHRQNDG